MADPNRLNVRKPRKTTARLEGRLNKDLGKGPKTKQKVGDRKTQNLEKRIARLEDRLGKDLGKGPKTKQSQKARMAELRAMRKGASKG